MDTGAAPTSTSHGPPPPRCGDNIQDPGEECDLGDLGNSDTGACTLQCTHAKCGDGLIWAGKEACDQETHNNDALYGGCTTLCQLGPRCGDATLQPPEECDFGEDNGTKEAPVSGVPCDDGCRFTARLAFLSSVTVQGGGFGGVEGAHALCRDLAKAAELDNSSEFKAWLSDATHSPFVDFKHGLPGLAYVRPDGIRVADDWDDLLAQGPETGITVTEDGKMKLFMEGVWTGTAPNGKAFDDDNCNNWGSSEEPYEGHSGISGVPEDKLDQLIAWRKSLSWTGYFGVDTCKNNFRLYCIEQQ